MKLGFAIVFLCVVSFFVGRGTSIMSTAFTDSKLEFKNPMMDAKGDALVSLENGAVVTKETKDYLGLPDESEKRGSYDRLKTFDLGNGLYTIGSESIVNSHFIVGKGGVILYDTGDNNQDAKDFYEEMRKVTNLPVRAIIYSHEHYALGAKYIVDQEKERGNKRVRIIGHPKTNEVMMTTGGVSTLHPEIGGVLMARSVEQFNLYLPDEGADARFKNTIIPGASGFVPVDTPVKEGQRLIIAGVELVFYTEDVGTDTENQVMVHIPSKKAVLNNVMWGWFPNIYSLRGGRYRNPQGWRESVEKIKKLNPEVLMSTHSTSLKGREKIAQRLQNYQDGLAYVLDQTLKGIALGMGPDELRYFVKLPAYLSEEATLVENYGLVSTMAARIFTANFGQFDRDATTIYKLHPKDEATRMILSMGGEARVKYLADKAYRDGDYQWSCQLARYLVKFNESNDNKKIKANCLNEIGYRSLATTSRSWALSQAREAQGKVAIIKNAPADNTQVKNNVGDFVNYYRIRINPELSENTNKFISMDFGNGMKYGLHIRNAVVDFVNDQKRINKESTLELKMKPEVWTNIYNNIDQVENLIQRNEISVVRGSNEEAIAEFAKFDQIYDWQNDPALKQLADRAIASEQED